MNCISTEEWFKPLFPRCKIQINQVSILPDFKELVAAFCDVYYRSTLTLPISIYLQMLCVM